MKVKDLIQILQGENQEMVVKVWCETQIDYVEATKEDIEISELCGCGDEEPPIDHYLVIEIGRNV